MKKRYDEDKELWPFDSSTSSAASTPKKTITRAIASLDNGHTLEVNRGENSSESSEPKDPVTYSAFGVTISTFKGLTCVSCLV